MIPESLIKLASRINVTLTFDKELLYVEAELISGGSILANAMDLTRKAKEKFVELQMARNLLPLIPNEFQILVAKKCMAKKAEH